MLGFLFYLAGFTFAKAMGLKLAQFDYGLWPPLIGVFYGSLGDGHLVNTPVWFVVALLCTLLIGQVLNQFVASKAQRLALALAIAALGQWVGSQVKLPFSLAPAMLGLVFFQVGFHLKSRVFALKTEPKKLWFVLIAGLIVSLFSQVNGFVAQATPAVGHLGWFLLFGFAGTFATLALVQLIEPCAGWLAFLGRYSLHIMLIHFLIIKSVKVVLTTLAHVDMATIDSSTFYGASCSQPRPSCWCQRSTSWSATCPGHWGKSPVLFSRQRPDMNIAVTGANGFVGQAVCEVLRAQQHTVRPLVRNTHPAWPEAMAVGSITADTDWAQALDGIDCVVHCAARVHVMSETEVDPLAAFRAVNVLGSQRLAEQAAQAGVKRLVFLSSLKVLGEMTEPGHPFQANTAPSPRIPTASPSGRRNGPFNGSGKPLACKPW